MSYLGAAIRDDMQKAQNHLESLDAVGWQEAGGEEIGAAFYLAATQEFRHRELSDIIDWVARIRGELGNEADDVDPKHAEWLIRAAVRDETHLVAELEPNTIAKLELVIAYKLMHDRELSDEELETFLDQATELAEHWRSEDESA